MGLALGAGCVMHLSKKLPEVVLESKPVAVVDRMAVKRDWRGLTGAIAIEAAGDSGGHSLSGGEEGGDH